jgi:hypothetical protein
MKKKLQFLGRTGRDFLALVGAGALIAYYLIEPRSVLLAVTTLGLAGVAYLTYQIRRALERKRTVGRARFHKPEIVVPDRLALGAPPMRRVYVRTDPDTGEEITKLEAAPWN